MNAVLEVRGDRDRDAGEFTTGEMRTFLVRVSEVTAEELPTKVYKEASFSH